MKMTVQNTQKPAEQPVFHKVAENLYRLESSGGYYALIKKGGKQFRRSLKTQDRKLAERRLKEIKGQIGGLAVTEDAKLGFEAVASRWLESIKHTLAASTIVQREIRIKNLAPFFKGIPLRNITPFQCECWAVKRGAKLATQTFVHELETMRNVFSYALKHGLILSSPATTIKRPKVSFTKVVIPTREQFVKLVTQIRRSDGRADSQLKSKAGADLIEFLAFSGARIGEARVSTWDDVKFQSNMIWLHGTKSVDSDRQIPMTAALCEFLLRLKSESSETLQGKILKTDSAKKCLATACKKLTFPKFTHHDFRHFFATTCIESGVDIPTVSRWLGHSDGGALAMRVYGHLQVEHSVAMSKRVNFDQTATDLQPKPAEAAAEKSEITAGDRRTIANAKTKYGYPWWVSENPLEVFWGQLHESVWIVPIEKFMKTATQAMGRQMFKQEFADRPALADEFSARTPEATLNEIRAKIPAQQPAAASREPETVLLTKPLKTQCRQ
jgi:integrase